jgi:hypothetical protein
MLVRTTSQIAYLSVTALLLDHLFEGIKYPEDGR